jgi:outer membrane usher protein FimD/PapC/outer membrane protein OmpA-like peptidoglycan-associated protein
MSTMKGVYSRRGLEDAALSFRKACLVLPLFILSFLLPSHSEASETIVVRVTLNHEEKGDYFVRLTDSGDFLVRRADLEGMGLTPVEADEREIGGEAHVRLGSIEGVEFTFDESTLTVEINALPSMLPGSTVDFMRHEREDVYRPRGDSFFLNYSLEYVDSEAPDSETLTLSNELGIKARGVLFLTDSLYTRMDGGGDFVRLMSSLTYDWRKRMQRLVGGDFVASAGTLGSSVYLGGASFSKQYRINPYLIKYPLPAVRGVVSMPSDVEVYVNGIRVHTGRFSPGGFELSNISSFSGAGSVEVVLEDPFGRRQRLLYPYYLTTRLLRGGFNDYSYSIGFLRESLGVESNRYGDPAFSAYHDRGVNDSLTVGFSAEGSRDVYNFGPQSFFRLGNAGVVSIALATSRDGESGDWGEAALMGYEYLGRRFNGTLSMAAFSREYTNLGSVVAERAAGTGVSPYERTRYSLGAGIGLSSRTRGSISFNAGVADRFEGEDRSTYSVSYSKSLSSRTTLSSRLTYVREVDSTYAVFLGVTHRFEGDVYLTADYEQGEDVSTQRVQVHNTEPSGEGFGYRVILERAEEDPGATYAFNPRLHYSTRFGRYGAEYFRSEPDTGEPSRSYRLWASGGIGYVGGVVGLSRPITDSFGLVRVGELEGIGVFVNNREVGRTDAGGKVFAPELSSYIHNQVSISDENVPIDYTLSRVAMHVSPSLRSGSVIDFDVKRLQAVTGRLMVEEDGGPRPLEYNDLRVTVGDEELTSPTGRGGEFYFEGVAPGKYAAAFRHKGVDYAFEMVVPESEEFLVDLGDIVVGRDEASGAGQVEAPEPLPEEIPAAKPEESRERPPPQDGDILSETPLSERPFLAHEIPGDEPASGPVPPVEAGFVFREFVDYVALVGTVHFFSGTKRMRGEDETVLRRVFRMLDYNLILRAEIEGFTDPEGGEEFNLELGMRRALVVKERLLGMGLPEWKIYRVRSHGESIQVCVEMEAACKRRNQRAVIKLVLRDAVDLPIER